MWLVVALEDRVIDLRHLGGALGSGRLSFAKRDRLWDLLGVIAGAVTPFAVVNDPAATVAVALDRGLLDHDPLNFHPLDNSMTTSVSPAGLVRFLEDTGHPPCWFDFTDT
jgi:Ala-tRNA(Pro) deacylase